MKYKLIGQISPNYSALQQILVNRGIEYEDIPHYINTTDEDINDFRLLGEDRLKEATSKLIKIIKNNLDAILIVDCDADGYGASALFINFLHDIFPAWVENHLKWLHHRGKQHGLDDCIDVIIEHKYPLVVCLDSGTNNVIEHKKIVDYGGEVLIADHHILEGGESPYATIINNQIGDYPNKEFCGTAVTWQLCRYIDYLLGTNYANKYIDLVALTLVSDMVDIKSIETKHLINKGFAPENIHNPFIYEMWQRNKFKLGDNITGWGAAFYIVPFVNAITRSGTQEEKELIFESMINFKAFQSISSTKRGCKGQEEKLVEQAIRTCINVKNRQSKKVDECMSFLEQMIIDNNMMDNKVLLFLLDKGEIDKNIAGLAGNKIMAKYQRPCCILTKVEDSYQGSARGCDKVGVTNFKDICAETGLTDWSLGHQGAFGLGLPAENISNFISATNEILKDMPSEPLYYVDYIYNGSNVNSQNIIDIAEMDSFWGTGVDESLIAIKNLKITDDMVTLMSADKNPTLKITLSNNVSIIKFSSSQEEYNKFTTGEVVVDLVGKCNKNCWMNHITPQIFIEDIEIIRTTRYCF